VGSTKATYRHKGITFFSGESTAKGTHFSTKIVGRGGNAFTQGWGTTP
jgi:hypothetical protein